MDDKENQELSKEEVNVYSMGCGDPKMGCMVDCIDFTPWLTPSV